MEELTPDEAAGLMKARVIYNQKRGCDWVAVLQLEGAVALNQDQPDH
jgi:hypothetical protein